MPSLSQYDPEEIRNIINDIKRRLSAVEQGFVVVNNFEEIVVTTVDSSGGLFPIRGTDERGVLRFISSQTNLFAEFGIDAYWAILSDDGLTPVVWVDATTDELMFSGSGGGGLTHAQIMSRISIGL